MLDGEVVGSTIGGPGDSPNLRACGVAISESSERLARGACRRAQASVAATFALRLLPKLT